jgi:hypothetical protein
MSGGEHPFYPLHPCKNFRSFPTLWLVGPLLGIRLRLIISFVCKIETTAQSARVGKVFALWSWIF